MTNVETGSAMMEFDVAVNTMQEKITDFAELGRRGLSPSEYVEQVEALEHFAKELQTAGRAVRSAMG